MEKRKSAFALKHIATLLLFLLLSIASQATVSGASDGQASTSKKTTVLTPRGTPVDALVYSETIITSQIPHLNDPWLAAVRSLDAQIISDATRTYNCHGYTWYMSEGGTGRLYIEDPEPYLTDGSYMKIQEANAVKGDKVVYGAGVHSAVVADEPGWVISKWGDGPLVRHRLRDVPSEFGPDLELSFYRKATSLSPPPNLRIIKITK